MNDAFDKMLLRLGENIKKDILLSKFPQEKIREIRLNVNMPIELVLNDNSFFINNKRLSSSDIQNIFASVCEYSVHTYKNEICEGFITAEGGYRVGICGTAVYDHSKIINIKDISGLNIRIPHEIIGASNKIIDFSDHGMLIVGPPCSGKTTLLRDISRRISKSKHIVIVDERMEIAGTYRGRPSFDIGSSMVLNGFYKNDGIAIAVRSMAPDYIICDEFSGERDINSALYAMKSGVDIIASIHAFDKNDLRTKPMLKNIIKSGIFEHVVFLNKKCEIYNVIKSEEIAL